MSDELKVFLSDLAVASGVGLAVGVIAACALVPVFQWWADHKVGGRASAVDDPASVNTDAPAVGGDLASPEVTPTILFLDDEIAQTARRVIDWHAS